jgi:hypothetical protein
LSKLNFSRFEIFKQQGELHQGYISFAGNAWARYNQRAGQRTGYQGRFSYRYAEEAEEPEVADL